MGRTRIGPAGSPGVDPPAGWGFKMSKRQKFKLYYHIISRKVARLALREASWSGSLLPLWDRKLVGRQRQP